MNWQKNLEATKVSLQHGSQRSDGLDYTVRARVASCAEVELPPPVGVCMQRERVWVARLWWLWVMMWKHCAWWRSVENWKEILGPSLLRNCMLKDGGDGVSKRHLKEIIFKIGRESLLASCTVLDKAPLVAKIVQEVGWEVVWDAALSRGGWSIRRMQLLVKALCHHCPDDPWHAHMLMVTCLERPWDSWSIRKQ